MQQTTTALEKKLDQQWLHVIDCLSTKSRSGYRCVLPLVRSGTGTTERSAERLKTLSMKTAPECVEDQRN